MPKIIEDEKIYQAVMRVVSEHGYAGTTTKQMAKAADVSEVTLFRKYDNKLQLIKQAVEAVISQTDFAAATQYTGDVEADLLRVIQAYQSSAVKHGQLIFVMLSELPRYPELVDLVNTPYDIYTQISHLIAKYQAEGVLRQEHPIQALSALLGPLIYSSVMRRTFAKEELPQLDLEKHVSHFLAGWKTDH